MAFEHVRDAFLGITMGMAAGDAVGTPWRGRSRGEIEALVDHIRQMPGGSGDGQAPGEWGPDTAQMLTVLESYRTGGTFDQEDIALRLAELHQSGLLYPEDDLEDMYEGLGDDGADVFAAARAAWVAGGGTACSSSPLSRAIIAALRYPNDLEKMIAETISLVQVTHHDPRCVDAALALNFLLVQCLHERFSIGLIDQTRRFIERLPDDPNYRKSVLDYAEEELMEHSPMAELPSLLDDRRATVAVMESLRRLDSDAIGTSRYVIHGFSAAVWALFNARSFEDGVVKMVSLGGETATNGALAGAMLGARFGLNNIPTAWLKVLKDRSRIVALSELLYGNVQDTFAR